MGVRERRKQPQIHPLVDDSIKAQARARRHGLVLRIRETRPGLGEMPPIDAGRERVDVRMQVPFRLEKAVAPGEHHICRRQQLPLQRRELGRCKAEVRELVHAVVDGAGGVEMPGEGQHHGGIVPAHQFPGPACHHLVEQPPQDGFDICGLNPLG